MRVLTNFLLTTVLAVASLSAVYFFWYKKKFHSPKHENAFKLEAKDPPLAEIIKLRNQARETRSFIRSNHYNTNTCFIIDMNISSGKKRFFVYNLLTDSVECAGLVTHGSGSCTLGKTLKFSNTLNSHCTSLGKYKVYGSYQGKFGLAFKLYGLDKTNNNAFDRAVVLHAHSCVPDEEVTPFPICASQGCPTVSPAFLQVLRSYIERSRQPMMLEIIN